MRSDAEQRFYDLRMEASIKALAIDPEEGYRELLKQLNRSRFFLQEAVDSLTPETLLEAGLQGTNILLELTRSSLHSTIVEQQLVLGKLMRLLETGSLEEGERNTLVEKLLPYTETLATLHGLTSMQLVKGSVATGYNDSMESFERDFSDGRENDSAS